jgi:hypothetical protein
MTNLHYDVQDGPCHVCYLDITFLERRFPRSFEISPQLTLASTRFCESILQWVLVKVFSLDPPAPCVLLRRPKTVVIGAGLTGI